MPAVADSAWRPEDSPVVDPDAPPAERSYATIQHLSLLQFIFIPLPIAGLIMWLARRHESPFLDDHGKESVNFQITLIIYGFASILLMTVLIGFPLFLAVGVLGIVGMIRGALAANRGEYYRYPACLRLIA